MLVLDHIAFGARDRQAVAHAIEALGFATSAPCRCEWEIAATSYGADAICVVFPEQYLDIIEIADPKWDEHLSSSALYRHGAAPTAIVLSGMDPEQVHSQIAGGRTPLLAPYPITRRFEHEPEIELAYRFLPLPGHGLPLGLISNASPLSKRQPLAKRQPTWQRHPNTAQGIGAVHVRVPSVREALTSLARRPLSLESSSAEAPEIAVGVSSIRLHAQTSGYLGRVSQLLPRTSRPTILAIEFHVLSLEAAASALLASGVRFEQSQGQVSVDPDQGLGAGVVFRAGKP